MKRKTVFCALSGGVDSSVAAARLVTSGFRVIGVFMKNWEGEPCPHEEDYEFVRRVCSKLDIRDYVWNFEEEYRETVLKNFLEEYKAGRTPNPDILCNKNIKFGAFLKKALNLGADYIATGHYARVVEDGGEHKLRRGADKNKDQSYFLYRLGQKELPYVKFPIGDLEKSEVRKLARQYGLATADRKDSQGICFIGKLNVKEYLKKHLKVEKGEVSMLQGKVIGRHEGLPLYTIGERAPVGGPGPFFIVAKDLDKNLLFVTNNPEDPALFASSCVSEDVSFVSKHREQDVQAQTRYRSKAVPAVLIKEGGLWETKFKMPERAVTTGQSVVWYDNNEVLGGGIIK